MMDTVCMMLSSNLKTCTNTTFDFETKAFGLCTYTHMEETHSLTQCEEACELNITLSI